MALRRGPWVEFETDDPDELVLIHPGWTNDTESLVLAIRETGWFATTYEAVAAAERAALSWGWVGLDDSGTLQRCNAAGQGEVTGDLTEVHTITFATLEN